MPAFAALTLTDGAATPVDHTFSPVSIDATGVARYTDRSSGISIGSPTVSFSSRGPTKGGKNHRVLAKVVFPVLEVTAPSTSTGIQPAPTKAYDLIANVEFVCPERSTTQDRKHLLAFTRDLLSDAIITSGVHDGETVY